MNTCFLLIHLLWTGLTAPFAGPGPLKPAADPAGPGLAAQMAATNKPAVDTRSAVDTPAANMRTADTRSVDTMAADMRAADTRSVDTRAADTRAAVDTPAANMRAADTRSADTRSVDTLPSYAERAHELHESIYHNFYDKGTGLFTETNSKTANERPNSYLWPLCALLPAEDALEADKPGQSYLPAVMRAIDQYRSFKGGVPGYDSYVVEQGGGDRFYDDNQWIGLACMDIYNRKHDKSSLSLASEIYRFMMTGYDTVAGGGLYWKEGDKSTKNTCSNGPGIVLALELYQATHKKHYLDTALVLYDWTNKTLQTPEGVYSDNINLKEHRMAHALYTYNTGTMLHSNVLLYTITHQRKYLDEAHRVAAASLKVFFRNGRFPGNYWFNVVLLRGYLALYAVDHDATYINAFKTDADAIWRTEIDKDGLAGTKPPRKLLDQAGLEEIFARLAQVK